MPGSVRRQLASLLNGFDGYSRKERLRADDLLVRSAAAGELGQAAAAVQAWQGRYRQERLPAPSHSNPLPDASLLRPLRELMDVERELRDAETLLRTAPFPPEDAVWARLRSRGPLLEALLAADTLLLTRAQEVRRQAEELSLDELARDPLPALAPLRAALSAVREALRGRGELLSVGLPR